MSQSTFVKPALTSLAFVLTGLLIGWLLFSGTTASLLNLAPARAYAAPDLAQFRDPANPGATLDVADCLPYGVAVFSNRIHVECNPGVQPVLPFRWYAMSNASTAQTAAHPQHTGSRARVRQAGVDRL